ncbi:hypothetical protein ABEB36_005655 [Hypothenemus hampei]|uniref:Nose resistant-to-fluoxetine protein N-terminal domain-containing protein n=1 Tax=Hypothenemus hampei TaxID=57062 RepID=A0ABD1EYZ4_HYPHA
MQLYVLTQFDGLIILNNAMNRYFFLEFILKRISHVSFLDASGRPPSGFLYGNNYWVGAYSQCMEMSNRKPFEIRLDKINRTETPYDYPPYDLRFVIIMMKHNSTLQFHMRLPLDYVIQLGLCVPKSCSHNEIFNLAQEYFSNNSLEFQKLYQVSLTVTQVRVLEEDFLWLLKLSKTIIFIVIVTIILILTIIGTVLDVKQHNKEKNIIRGQNNDRQNEKQKSFELANIDFLSVNKRSTSITFQILKCFSFYSNVKKWSYTKLGGDSLPVIHGLRFLSMVWVISVHTSYFQRDFIQNIPHGMRLSESFFAQIFSNSTFCVDTYFFLSGFLLAYLFFKKKEECLNSKEINYFNTIKKYAFMLTHRFLRLTPTYVIALLLCSLVYTYFSRQSTLFFDETPEVLCDKYWWRNLLYINNLFPRSEMCLSWSWYLSVDMQFFAIGSFLLLLSIIHFKTAAGLLGFMIFIQIAATTFKSYSLGFIPTLDDQLEHLDAIYDLPWNRIGPYLVGVATAYILIIKLDNKLILKERTRLILWVIFPLLNLWILFTLYTRQLSVEYSAFYMGVSRTLWGVGIAWFVIALNTGNAQLLRKLMSYSAWVPLGRLTYCAYLLNPLVITMIALGSESGIIATTPQTVLAVTGVFTLTMLMSFLFCLFFETPFILLTKLFLMKKCSDQGSSTQGSSTTSVSTIA